MKELSNNFNEKFEYPLTIDYPRYIKHDKPTRESLEFFISLVESKLNVPDISGTLYNITIMYPYNKYLEDDNSFELFDDIVNWLIDGYNIGFIEIKAKDSIPEYNIIFSNINHK